MHDGVIQSLFAVGMGLQGTALRAGDKDVESRIEAAVTELDRTIRDLRNYIFGLRPGLLADRQLEAALERLLEELEQKNGVTGVADIDAGVAAELASRAGDVVQLTREALSNVGRHSGAKTCRVTLSRSDSAALLEIDDDGSGFDTGAPGSGQGLRNMRERVQGMGGSLEIESGADRGTLLRIRIPL
jgi:signal transduction histidine kinase